MLKKRFSRRMIVTVTALAAALLAVAPPAGLVAQGVPSDYASRLERARGIEREIAALEEQLARAQKDWITVSQRLADIERKVLDCYLEIDSAETAVENARRSLNGKLRYLYMEGRQDALVQLLGSKDVSELLTRYDYALHVAKREADTFEELKQKRSRLRESQERLIAYKHEAVRLARGSDTASVEALISQRRGSWPSSTAR